MSTITLAKPVVWARYKDVGIYVGKKEIRVSGEQKDEYTVPLYAHPAPTPVPLTGQAIAGIFAWETGHYLDARPAKLMAFARAIERHHGIGIAKPETEAKP